LTQSRVRQSTEAYSAVAEQGGRTASAVNSVVMDYAQSLLESLRDATALSDNGKDTLQTLLQGANSLNKGFDARRLDKAEQFNSRLLDGLDMLFSREQLAV